MFKLWQKRICSLLLLVGACANTNAAVELNGTFGFTPIGDIAFSGTDLEHASSVTFPSTEVVNTVPSTYNGSPNDFFAGTTGIPILSHVTLSPLTLSLSALSGSFSAVNYPAFLEVSSGTAPNNRYDFDLLELMKTSNGSSSLDIYGKGILRDTQGVFADTPGLFSIAFTQTGQGGAINGSFSIATTAVPEPGTFLAGFCALGFLLLGSFTWAKRSTLS